MSKLFRLKDWLTLDEAVNHISNVLGEPITLADIYKFALDGHLKLSANFVNYAPAKKVMLVKNEDVRFENIPNDNPAVRAVNHPKGAEGGISGSYRVKTVEDELFQITGVWDLTMLGSERFDIEHRYHQETSGICVKEAFSSGVYLQQGDILCQLYTSINRRPSSKEQSTSKKREIKRGLLTLASPYVNHRPNISESNGNSNSEHDQSVYDTVNYYAVGLDEEENVLVIRTAEVTRFIQSLEDTPQEAKPLHDKERTTLLVLLASILNKANFDLNERGVAGKIRRATESNNTPVSGETIRNLLPHLRDIAELKQRN
ncbi:MULTISPECIES: hypothetical protein [unclassified Shewanella]|uniref:hypothetical protein n=1 Tax=unclassified Shewanella TaxID=196818 RepID=UPI001BC7F34C|nr:MULTISPECIES: hypothetical protein [unclassified Shewanella]GIU13547.1 hypothetical protein TUM4444_22160 [Shewanella sp. MBTL60-112-B1]GIU28033.1 hypothetical protein TUM4445_08800 [Shewanella sp. MBTL60-112-B2]